MTRRLLSFAGCSVSVEYEDPPSERIVEFLFKDVASVPDYPVHADYRLEQRESDGKIVVYRDGKDVFSNEAEGVVAGMLMDQVLFSLADQNKDGALLHAACVSRNGRAVLMPGTSGSGKTTLSAWLLRNDFSYLSDELVFVPLGSTQVECFTRPLNVKQPAVEVVEKELGVSTDGCMTNRRATLYDHRHVNADFTSHTPELGVIVFPKFKQDSELNLEEISKAQAGLKLMECAINARNLPEHGFPEITRIARQVPAYQLTYSSFAQLSGQLDTLLNKILQ